MPEERRRQQAGTDQVDTDREVDTARASAGSSHGQVTVAAGAEISFVTSEIIAEFRGRSRVGARQETWR